jgi:hypothetical protein
MSHKYQIIEFYEPTGSIVVQFKNEEEVLGIFNVDLPFTDDGLYIHGAELETYIMSMYPHSILERRERLSAGVANSADIAALVVPLPPPPLFDPEITIPITVVDSDVNVSDTENT